MINVNTSCHDVLVLANEDPDDTLPHPFWYACVLGVYHAQVLYGRKKFLWVRWFGCDPEWTDSPSSLHLDCIGFVPQDDPSGSVFWNRKK